VLAFDVYSHWETDLRPFTVAALRSMSPEQLAWKPPGWHSSALELADHMLAAEWIWIYRNALRRAPWEERWRRGRFADLDSLLEYWAEVHRVTVEWLKETPVRELNRKLPMPYPGQPWATMNWVVYHVMEHEIHHRGQIFMLMRMQGIDPPEI
jgi:uncharacterized damage-inducible protein DinB